MSAVTGSVAGAVLELGAALAGLVVVVIVSAK